MRRLFLLSLSRDTEWVLVQRFSTAEQIDAWRRSDEHQKLMDELTPYLESENLAISEWKDTIYGTIGSISVAVVTQVKKGQEEAYFAYERKYQAAQARTPGYRGAYVEHPKKGTAGIWKLLLDLIRQSYGPMVFFGRAKEGIG